MKADKLLMYDLIKDGLDGANDMYNAALIDGEDIEYYRGLSNGHSVMMNKLISIPGDVIDDDQLDIELPDGGENYVAGFNDALIAAELYFSLAHKYGRI